MPLPSCSVGRAHFEVFRGTDIWVARRVTEHVVVNKAQAVHAAAESSPEGRAA